MGFLDELKRLAHPYEDEPDDVYDDYGDESESFPEPKKERVRDTSDYERRSNKVVNIHTTTQLQVVLVKPERFENASEIADHLRYKRTVVLNLESTNKDIARRLLDFLSGVAYANEGQIKKVALSTFIITPYNVDIQGDLLDELENNGLFF
jgi:cell division inhibitor SepF